MCLSLATWSAARGLPDWQPQVLPDGGDSGCRGAAYTSGPQWLAEHVLFQRHVLAVAGTHGKTTTAAMLAWILECAGQKPGFLDRRRAAELWCICARLGCGSQTLCD
jgi:hypothetical protein